MRNRRFLCIALLAATSFSHSARAQDPGDSHAVDGPAASKEEQIQRIRRLPAEEQRRLKQALDRFRALPSAERETLRKKAREVGTERLGELAGRDVAKLRTRHVALERELDEVMKLLGAPERLAGLTEAERAWIRGLALRGFQNHCRVRLIEAAGVPGNIDTMPPAERRAALEKGQDLTFLHLLDEKSPEEKARILTLPGVEQRRERARLFAEWRMRETVTFVKRKFGGRLLNLLKLTPERRQALIGRQVRWFEITTLLSADGAQPDTLRMLRQLAPDERAQVSAFYGEVQPLPPAERRARVEEKIAEIYGKGAFDAERHVRPAPIREILRDRALRERAESQGSPR